MWQVLTVLGCLSIAGIVDGKPGHGYGSYDNYNNGLAYNVIPAQPVVKEIHDFYVSAVLYCTLLISPPSKKILYG